MKTKAFALKVNIYIKSVTCPGVCLNESGNISLRIKTLKSTATTSPTLPKFPLEFKENIKFSQVIDCAVSLSELEHHLNNENLLMELLQWPNPDRMEVVLARFDSKLGQILFPSTKSRRTGATVNLLMNPLSSFKGGLAPKIELFTQFSVNEATSKTHERCLNKTLVSGRLEHDLWKFPCRCGRHRPNNDTLNSLESNDSMEKTARANNRSCCILTQQDSKIGNHSEPSINHSVGLCSDVKVRTNSRLMYSDIQSENHAVEPCVICSKYMTAFASTSTPSSCSSSSSTASSQLTRDSSDEYAAVRRKYLELLSPILPGSRSQPQSLKNFYTSLSNPSRQVSSHRKPINVGYCYE